MNIPQKYEDVVANLDAALGREAALREELATIYSDRDAEKKMKAKARDQRDVQTIMACELQQRLTAADERNDNRDSEIFAQVQSALRRSFSLGQIYWQQADSDSTCQQNKSDQTMETQEQHILNVLKSVGAALKQAEEGDGS